MIRAIAYMIQGVDGLKSDKVYLDQESATIALRENYSLKQIEVGEATLRAVELMGYTDLREDVKVKQSCGVCSGTGIKIIEEEVEVITKKPETKSKKKVKVMEKIKKEVMCEVCSGEKDTWVDKKAVLIY